jgi:hypothetical protein
MTPKDIDDDLRVAFTLLRESDAARSKLFSTAWFDATRCAAALPLNNRPKYGLMVASAGVLIAAVLLGRNALMGTNEVLGPTSHVPLSDISQWRAPSDVLLATPGQELWRDIPRLGDSTTVDRDDLTH